MDNKSTVERAFELAREGDCQTVRDIRRKLKTERYESVESHLDGSTIKRQLMAAMKSSA